MVIKPSLSLRGGISNAARWFSGLFSRVPGHYEFGRDGERLAERHLRRAGFRVVTRNFRAAGAEIDLVALEGDTLVFVEVKARRSVTAGRPEAAVDDRKQLRIRRAAEIYASRYRADRLPMRFDVVAITSDGRRPKIEHLRNAF
ncbi:MAG TPA: YraN family protein [Candidatus Binataceae bacterium]|nr:YraN family protein [Candidatus Binataceae bacterium]